MNIKKIISMGILCGLSVSGSATSNQGANYPLAKCDPAKSCQNYGDNFFPSPFDCFPGSDCIDLQGLAQEIIGNVNKFVGDNPTEGQVVSAVLLAGAWEIYRVFNEHPEAVYTLSNAFNGTLSPEKKREILNNLDKVGAQLLDWVQYFAGQFGCLPAEVPPTPIAHY